RWDFALERAGVNPADYPLTLGMFGMFFISYPFTVVWKMVAGAPPFPSGRIPMPPLPGGSEGPRANPSADLLRFQAFQGMVQTLDAIADGLIRAEAKVIGDAKAAGVPQPWEIPALFNRVFTAAHVVGAFPGCCGSPWPGGDAQHNLPYARYGLTFLFNMLDTVVTFTTGKLA